jgi:hypothetical protein
MAGEDIFISSKYIVKSRKHPFEDLRVPSKVEGELAPTTRVI